MILSEIKLKEIKMNNLVKTVVKVTKCSDGSEKWTYNDGSYDVKTADWLKYAETAQKKEQKEWRKMTERIHLRTGRSVA